MTFEQKMITIGMVVLGTAITRFLPFLVFPSGKPTPKYIRYLGKVLPAAIFGLTGGYIVGFVLAALIVGFLAAHGKRTVPFLCLYMVVGCAACYLLGTIWYSTLSGNGFFASLAVCVLPYLPCDVFKILLAAVLTRALDRRLAVFRK